MVIFSWVAWRAPYHANVLLSLPQQSQCPPLSPFGSTLRALFMALVMSA